jgi:hypothetical protein
MRITGTLLVLIVPLTAALPVAAKSRPPKLVTHQSKSGRFRVQMPHRPETETKNLTIGPGNQSVAVTTEKCDGPGSTVFAVTYADYPTSFQDVPARTILDGVRDGLKGTDGKVTEDAETFLGADKLHGRQLRIDARRRAIRARVFLVGHRLYQVMVTGPADQVGSTAADDFLNSFELAK